MKTLKLASTGPQVRKWQTFLRGQEFLLTVTGTFDKATDSATRQFQTKHKLEADGLVGNQTFGKAMQLGFEGVDLSKDPDSGFPAKPDFEPLVSTADRQKLFGKFGFVSAPEPGNPEAIRILGDWEDENIVKVTITQLVGIKGTPKNGVLRFHKKAAQQLQDLWAEIEKKRLLDRVLRWDGSFNARFVRGSKTTLSNHAFGTAFDINADENPLGAEPAFLGEPGCVFELVPLAHKFGFYWGGHFTRRDGMHFEVAKIL